MGQVLYMGETPGLIASSEHEVIGNLENFKDFFWSIVNEEVKSVKVFWASEFISASRPHSEAIFS